MECEVALSPVLQSYRTQKIMLGIKAAQFISKRWHSLNVLYFGSDEFSIHSLKALNDLKGGAVSNIQVVTRPSKWCGRSKSVLKEVPIVKAARSLGMPEAITCDSRKEMLELNELIHQKHFNMVMAVSFGKLIPAELLARIPYSLNIHPSLLPKYKGASPIQYALLNNDEYTGVTIQTLHPCHFDQGAIVAQSSPLNLQDLLAKGTVSQFSEDYPRRTAILMDQLGLEGGSLLKKVISDKLYLQSDVYQPPYEPSYAPKITSQMKRLDWLKDSARTALNKLETLGPLYAFKEVEVSKTKKTMDEVSLKRVIFHRFHVIRTQNWGLTPGQFTYHDTTKSLYVQCHEGALQLHDLQFEGYKIENAKQFMASLRKRCGTRLSKNLFFF
ncbi:BN860_08944g1_1 [Zygosaccharomyces bailii CLIB 213]|uniref:Methionyl-tRNA formyltransferase, mitochondrial n=1 Tax=Zygosaccharomyces bailii (strain CLIB 213 / ATCC 58445 / CBS 680 / BCRC 21525 / NBRC 1098 / NCYC 1416 / NRRL Y-2227) TaxID=1333698 RepID=A0A8J2T427_ZYGB2|nr:BN860_08944g1_1 [Zygosaccharomyces bailii CLIB 213]